VFAAKSGNQDALYILDVNTLKREKIPFDLDGIFSAAWNPVKDQIAFVGNQKSACDLYLYDLDSKSLTNLTNDMFADLEPSWNDDGTELAFVSSRGYQYQKDRTGMINSQFNMAEHDYSQRDIYTINIASRSISRITNTEHLENDPMEIDNLSGKELPIENTLKDKLLEWINR
jgi:Tol biopolymer transport system component